jgi:hypothetical protein
MLEITMPVEVQNIRKNALNIAYNIIFSSHAVRANVIRDGQIATDAMM